MRCSYHQCYFEPNNLVHTVTSPRSSSSPQIFTKGISNKAMQTDAEPFAVTENAFGSCSSGTTQGDRSVRGDANLVQIYARFSSPWTRQVSAVVASGPDRQWVTIIFVNYYLLTKRTIFTEMVGRVNLNYDGRTYSPARGLPRHGLLTFARPTTGHRWGQRHRRSGSAWRLSRAANVAHWTPRPAACGVRGPLLEKSPTGLSWP
jgi:hypothetical protein